MIPRKGSRKLIVGDVAYRWVVSRWRRRSAWGPAEAGAIDARWLAVAQRFGLGEVANVAFTLAAELEQEARSRLVVTIHAHVIDGFLGPEQTTRVTPRTARELIEEATRGGWDPHGAESFALSAFDRSTSPSEPKLLLLPDVDVFPDIEGYAAKVRAVKVERGS